MTMPHLMNCDHIEEGWCLDYVVKLYNRKERAESLLRENLNQLDEYWTVQEIKEFLNEK